MRKFTVTAEQRDGMKTTLEMLDNIITEMRNINEETAFPAELGVMAFIDNIESAVTTFHKTMAKNLD